MNLFGYYGSEEIWIPDPIAEQISYSSSINQFKEKEQKKKEKEKERL